MVVMAISGPNYYLKKRNGNWEFIYVSGVPSLFSTVSSAARKTGKLSAR